MASEFSRPPCPRTYLASALAMTVLFIGCSKAPAIKRYQVTKEKEPVQDRMLAAIVPHGQAAWFFKLAGPEDAVGKHVEAFEALVKSITFPADAEGKPKWTTPEDWEQRAGGSDLRFATISIPAEPKPLDVTVMTLPWAAEDNQQQVLSNVNRWRGQMQLDPIAAADLVSETKSIKLAAAEPAIEATMVDLKGRLSAGGMPPFASGAGKGEMPPDHPPVDKSASAPPKSTVSTPKEPAQPKAVPAQDELPFTYSMPDGWTPLQQLPPFAVAAFAAGPDRTVQITVSPLGLGGGGMLSNVNRWRGQVGLPNIAASELEATLHTLKVDGNPAQMVRLFGPEGAARRQAIVSVVTDRDDATWFIRMRGDATPVENEQANFDKFVASVKFRSGEK